MEVEAESMIPKEILEIQSNFFRRYLSSDKLE